MNWGANTISAKGTLLFVQICIVTSTKTRWVMCFLVTHSRRNDFVGESKRKRNPYSPHPFQAARLLGLWDIYAHIFSHYRLFPSMRQLLFRMFPWGICYRRNLNRSIFFWCVTVSHARAIFSVRFKAKHTQTYIYSQFIMLLPSKLDELWITNNFHAMYAIQARKWLSLLMETTSSNNGLIQCKD